MTGGTQPARLAIEAVSHAFGHRRILDDVNLSVEPAEILCLLGPSGCGKTTLLRIAAGLEEIQQGRVLVDGRVLADPSASAPPERRNITLLFQDFALFPHLSALDNVTFGLRHLPAGMRRASALEALEQVGMLDHADRYPHVLSAGEQQRIALARARAPQPRVMLLDEPFSNLDSRRRSQLRDLVLHVLKQTVASALIVTHDAEEAMFLGDRIAVMRDGRIVQQGRPEELYDAPADAFVAELLGEANRIEGVVADGHVETPLGCFRADGFADGARVDVLVRPEAIELGANGGDSRPARVITARMLGQSSLVHLGLQGGDGGEIHLHARIAARGRPSERTLVGVRLDRARVLVFHARDRE